MSSTNLNQKYFNAKFFISLILSIMLLPMSIYAGSGPPNSVTNGYSNGAQNNISMSPYAAASWNGYSAIKTDGTIGTWGYTNYYGEYDDKKFEKIYNNYNAFAGITEQGEVYTWGGSGQSGSSTLVPID